MARWMSNVRLALRGGELHSRFRRYHASTSTARSAEKDGCTCPPASSRFVSEPTAEDIYLDPARPEGEVRAAIWLASAHLDSAAGCWYTLSNCHIIDRFAHCCDRDR